MTSETSDAPYRQTYLSYDEITAILHRWAETWPDLARVTSLGQTEEGREIWLLTVGPQPDEIRPAVWVDGNMHAAELCGSSVALAIAEDMLRFHADGVRPRGLSERVCEVLQNVLFYVVPRISPDGAERQLAENRFVRSNTRDDRPDHGRSYWRPQDVDGDGLALAMRVEDPTGEFVESGEVPNLMLPRTLDDEGPFYKLYPEGVIENYDGRTVPSPSFLSDSPTDLNRNFPWAWVPEHDQIGAGAYPGSEPESRAVIEFTSQRPNIFAWLNLHTFGGVGIRPLSHLPDSKMDQSDLAIFRQVAKWLEEASGYPTVSGCEEFTYEPDQPIHGDLTDYAYHQRGCISWVVELWDLFAQVGLERRKPFVKCYTDLSRADLVAIGQWDLDHNKGRVVRSWKAVEHPQLGRVEVGGIDQRVGIFNPPYEHLPEVCAQQSEAFLKVAAMAPMIRVADVSVEDLGNEIRRVDITVENHGYLSSQVLASAGKLSWNEALYMDLECAGCVLAEGPARRPLGHLDGWGRGLGDGSGALYYPYGRGSTGTARQSVTVRGSGTLVITVSSCRMGSVRHEVRLG
jgi:hypothetical protein